jgi:hypothetical protein
VIIDLGIRQLWREKSDRFVFFAGVIVVFPVMLIAIRGSNLIYSRHFIIAMAFLLILFSFVLASLYDRGGCRRVLCLSILALYLLANGAQLIGFFKYGRGQYAEALRFMAAESKRPVVTIGGDSDFRILTMLEFYVPRTLGGRTAHYYDHDLLPKEGPEWMICDEESFLDPALWPKQLADGQGNQYDLVRTFPASPISGMHWFIFHNRAN